jgi:23S rRNA (guanine745-N1)-methyltransferase
VSALARALEWLACPVCGSGPALDGAVVRCAGGHAFDVARQGYVSLLAGGAHPGGDSAAMVAARERFLAAGHFAPVADAVAGTVAGAAAAGGPVVELGAGTAYYLAAALERLPERDGIAFDASAAALRRAARAHPRAAAIGADAWGALPLRDGVAGAVLCVFAPRGPEEIARVLAPGGALVVAAPTERHLGSLVEALGLIGVDRDKRARLERALDSVLVPEGSSVVELDLALSRDAVRDVVWMGPTARHAEAEEMEAAIAALPEPFATQASVTISVHRR